MSEELSLRELLRSDFERAIGTDHVKPRGLRRKIDVLSQAGFMTVVIYRLGQAAHRRGLYPLGRLAYLVNVILFGAEIYPQASIGPGFFLAHPVGVGIGAGAVIGADVSIYKGVTIGTAGMRNPARDGFPVIGDRCKIYDGARLFGPIEVGDDCRLRANTILMRSIPAGSTVTAPPSEISKPRGAVRRMA